MNEFEKLRIKDRQRLYKRLVTLRKARDMTRNYRNSTIKLSSIVKHFRLYLEDIEPYSIGGLAKEIHDKEQLMLGTNRPVPPPSPRLKKPIESLIVIVRQGENPPKVGDELRLPSLLEGKIYVLKVTSIKALQWNEHNELMVEVIGHRTELEEPQRIL